MQDQLQYRILVVRGRVLLAENIMRVTRSPVRYLSVT